MNKVNELMSKMMAAAQNANGGAARSTSPYSRHTSAFTRLVDSLPAEKSPIARNDVLRQLEPWVTAHNGFEEPVPPAARADLMKLWDTLLFLVEDKFGAPAPRRRRPPRAATDAVRPRNEKPTSRPRRACWRCSPRFRIGTSSR